MIVVVDYGVGNLHSVVKALEKVGGQVALTSDAKIVKNAAKLVLPGVGSFGNCMNNLASYGLVEAVKDFAASDRPFLGICVGMQLLFAASEESPGVPGLGVFKGMVRRLPECGLKIPHIGWNDLSQVKKTGVFAHTSAGEYVYFVHSYAAQPEDAALVTARVNYGGEVVAAVGRGKIQAVQFHPEKSAQAGLKILQSFKEM